MKLKILCNSVVLIFLAMFSYFKYVKLINLNLENQKYQNFLSEILKIKNFIKNQNLQLNHNNIFLQLNNMSTKESLEKLNKKYNLKNFNFKFIENSKPKILASGILKKILRAEISFTTDSEKNIFQFLKDLKNINLMSIESLRISENLKVFIVVGFVELNYKILDYISLKNISKSSLKKIIYINANNDFKIQDEIYLFSHHPEHTLLCVLNNQAYVITMSISDQKIISKKWMKLNDFIGDKKIIKIDTKSITLTTNYPDKRIIKLGERWF